MDMFCCEKYCPSARRLVLYIFPFILPCIGVLCTTLLVAFSLLEHIPFCELLIQYWRICGALHAYVARAEHTCKGKSRALHSTSVWTAPVIEGGDGISIVNRASMTVKSVEFRATAGAGVATLADSRRSLERGGSGILNGSGLPASTFTYSRPTIKITLPVAGGRRPKLINEGTASLFFETL